MTTDLALDSDNLDLSNLELPDDPGVQNEIFMQAFNSGQGAIFEQLYRDDAISNLSGGPLSGEERTRFITDFLATNPVLTSTVRQGYITGDTSLLIVDYQLEVTGEDGQTTTLRGVCTDVLRRQAGGSWIMVIDRPVPDTPPE